MPQTVAGTLLVGHELELVGGADIRLSVAGLGKNTLQKCRRGFGPG
ncbi:hypothetical protein GCM10011585_10390 [Edaphobacter dinghuensis]|uniref:Uncharacterized protein n=1 Tax=Edaphobacter dinghuensis TaxID=1560005 RepID=A0A917M245_9BACT|nr:hypothetical protein GCM10011585_10390 [Edaphobacter dinghuensis]